MKKTLVITAVAAAALAAVAMPFVAHADPGEGGWFGGHGRMGHHGGGGPGAGFGMMGAGGPMQMFQEIDANDDGKITQDEIDAARAEKFAAANADNQGGVTIEEFEPFFWEQRRQMMVRAFQFLDSDGDGEITEAELSERTDGLVARMDRNGDGALSMEDRRGRGERHGWWGRGGDDDERGPGRGPGMGPGMGPGAGQGPQGGSN